MADRERTTEHGLDEAVTARGERRSGAAWYWWALATLLFVFVSLPLVGETGGGTLVGPVVALLIRLPYAHWKHRKTWHPWFLVIASVVNLFAVIGMSESDT